MKDFKLCAILLLMLWNVSTLWAAKQSSDSTTVAKPTETTLGIHPWKPANYLGQQGHWSLSVEAGINLFDGDIHQDKTNIIPKTQADLTLGIGVEYSINPIWGVGAEYYYAPYRVGAANGTPDSKLTGTMQSAELFMSFNLIDAWFPRRPTKIFSWYVLVGAGLSWYNCTLYNPAGISVNGMSIGTDIAHVNSTADEKTYDMCAVIPLGMAFEFNISRSLAIGLKGMYRLYTKDNLDSYAFSAPTKVSVQNDCMEYATANIRWKFPARKRDHIRNWRYEDENNTQLQQLAKRVDDLENAEQESVASRVDTVYRVDTVVVVAKKEKSEIEPLYIYFNNDQYTLTDESLQTIHQVAQKMQADTSLCVELRAYADNIGSLEYNRALSNKRAQTVQKELVKTYKISDERTLANGQGKISFPSESYRPNRRVEIHFISKDDLQKLRETMNVESVSTKAEVVPPTDKQAAQTITFDEPRVYTEFIETETIHDGQTLSSLSRKHYGDGGFWVYIYEANQAKIKNPGRIYAGMKVKIPVLPEELINKQNPKCIEYAKMLEDKYEKE